jgi:hypothetical protein
VVLVCRVSHTAQQGLNSTRKHIDDLVTECSTISVSIKNLVAKLDQINTPTINEKLDRAVTDAANSLHAITETKSVLQTHIDQNFIDFKNFKENAVSLRKIVMILLAISVVSLVISIVSLLM